jgi:hypothetical protein
VRDIDTAVVDSLKVLDPNRPIREATELRTSLEVRFVPNCDIANVSRTKEKPPEGGSLNSTR